MQKIIGIIFIIIGAIGFLFFNNYKGTLIHYTFLLMLASICIVALGFYFKIKHGILQDRKLNAFSNKIIDNLRQYGEKIIVHFDACEIKEYHYQEVVQEENEFGTGAKIKAYDVLLGYTEHTIEYKNILQTIIIYTYLNPFLNKQEVFKSATITLLKTTLQLKLMAQKTSYIYVDKKDRKNYYFDLSFLT
jgi:hypothetical protein